MADVTITATLPLLQKGAGPAGVIGVHVQAFQSLLNVKGHNPVSVDGDFGSVTEAAVTEYQSDRGLLVDGIVGKQTWTALIDLPQT